MDETNTTEPNTIAPAAPAPQPVGTPAPTITPEIEAMIAQREAVAAERARNAAMAEARRIFESKAREQPKPAPSQPATATAPDVNSQISRLRSFDRALARFDLSESARDVIESDFNVAAPPDPSAWIAARAEAFGWKRLGATTATVTTQPVTPSPATPAPAPPSMPGSTPPATPAITADTSLVRIAQVDPSRIGQIAAELGPQKFMERLRGDMARIGRVSTKRR